MGVLIPAVHSQLLSHVCDAWRWVLAAGGSQSILDMLPLLVPHGILLTVTTSIDTPLGVQVQSLA